MSVPLATDLLNTLTGAAGLSNDRLRLLEKRLVGHDYVELDVRSNSQHHVLPALGQQEQGQALAEAAPLDLRLEPGPPMQPGSHAPRQPLTGKPGQPMNSTERVSKRKRTSSPLEQRALLPTPSPGAVLLLSSAVGAATRQVPP